MNSSKFKVGDRVRDLGKVCPEFEGIATIVEERGPECFIVECPQGWHRGRYASEIELVPDLQSKGGEALRYQDGKPQLDYLFTYEGGVHAAFEGNHPYYDTLEQLAVLYRMPADHERFGEQVENVLNALSDEAREAGRTLALDIADTNTRGAKKYAVGNYLKGGSWRQYYRGALSHALELAQGIETDGEGFSHHGNFHWNVLMACHSARTGLGTDDRIRCPK